MYVHKTKNTKNHCCLQDIEFDANKNTYNPQT